MLEQSQDLGTQLERVAWRRQSLSLSWLTGEHQETTFSVPVPHSSSGRRG